MIHAPDPSRRIARDPTFAVKADKIAARHRDAPDRTRGPRSGVVAHGISRIFLALWCIKIAVATAQGPSAQAEMVSQLEDVSPLIAALAAPDPLTRNAQSMRFRISDWVRSVERVF